MPRYFFNFAADLIYEMVHASLELQFDINRRQIIYGEVLTGLREMMLVIGRAQIASVLLRNETGTGKLNDFCVLPELERLGYTGFVGCEYLPGAIRSRTRLVEAFRKRCLPGLGRERRA